jgi:hypothetical protein
LLPTWLPDYLANCANILTNDKSHQRIRAGIEIRSRERLKQGMCLMNEGKLELTHCQDFGIREEQKLLPPIRDPLAQHPSQLFSIKRGHALQVELSKLADQRSNSQFQELATRKKRHMGSSLFLCFEQKAQDLPRSTRRTSPF